MLLGLSYNCYTFAKDSHNRVILNIFNLAETTSSIRLPISLPKFLDQSPKSVFKEVSKWILQEKMSLESNGPSQFSSDHFWRGKMELEPRFFSLKICLSPSHHQKINGKNNILLQESFFFRLIGSHFR